MDIVIICVTIILATLAVCYSFGPNLKPEVEYIYKEVESEKENVIKDEDEELENALVTSLGEINNLFGGVENDED